MKPSRLILLAAPSLVLAAGCDFDPMAEKYDRLRYEELQEANCAEMAAVGSKPLVSKSPGDYDTLLRRCEEMKQLSFEEYQALAARARETGVFDLPDTEETSP